MKTKSILLAVALCAGTLTTHVILTGCTTTQNTVAYKTIYGVEVSTTAAYDVYASLVIKGTVTTNDVPKISKAYNDFQKATQTSILLSRNNTNAPAPATLIKAANNVIDLIASITGK
jgi:hypothetical protein